jgi:periplasmic protein TonB
VNRYIRSIAIALCGAGAVFYLTCMHEWGNPHPTLSKVGDCTEPSGDGALRLASRAEPVYPKYLRALGIEGNVIVQAQIAASGSVVAADVVESRPAYVFDAQSIAAVRMFTYCGRDPNAAPVTRRIRIRYVLQT